ncbi:hypothetical protein Golax_018496 [Gossypium laxum]|uniref:CCHC-type domain-containing protein n=1 Tax=Gossypium laxum TaxID=34288 RepID=A0A7J8Z3I5_9ROSI|nr:hypothetical protein [Gossypium laxum]
MVGQNLFLIEFELEEDLETIMEGRPWLLLKSIILFDRLIKPMERPEIRLTSSPFWIKIGSCLPEFDKKDFLHAIGVTFGRVIRSEINGDICRLRINLDVQKPLRRGIFVSIDNINKSWISFKYEKLPMFCFGCGRMGHSLKDCLELNPIEKEKFREDPPYTLALIAKSNLIGKESMKFNVFSKKVRAQCSYTGCTELLPTSIKTSMEGNNKSWRPQRMLQQTGVDEAIEKQEEASIIKKYEQLDESKYNQVNISNFAKKTSWKRIAQMAMMNQGKSDNSTKKRKTPEEGIESCYMEVVYEEEKNRLKKKGKEGREEVLSEGMMETMAQNDAPKFMGSATASRQAE